MHVLIVSSLVCNLYLLIHLKKTKLVNDEPLYCTFSSTKQMNQTCSSCTLCSYQLVQKRIHEVGFYPLCFIQVAGAQKNQHSRAAPERFD